MDEIYELQNDWDVLGVDFKADGRELDEALIKILSSAKDEFENNPDYNSYIYIATVAEAIKAYENMCDNIYLRQHGHEEFPISGYLGGLKEIKRLAQEGEAHAQAILGMEYLDDECDVDSNENLILAHYWLTQAVNQGSAKGEYYLAEAYGRRDFAEFVEGGKINEQDLEIKRLQLYLSAALKGDRDAQFYLGAINENPKESGFSVLKDDCPNTYDCIKWYKKAAEQGDMDAIEDLERLKDDYKNGEGIFKKRNADLEKYIVKNDAEENEDLK